MHYKPMAKLDFFCITAPAQTHAIMYYSYRQRCQRLPPPSIALNVAVRFLKRDNSSPRINLELLALTSLGPTEGSAEMATECVESKRKMSIPHMCSGICSNMSLSAALAYECALTATITYSLGSILQAPTLLAAASLALSTADGTSTGDAIDSKLTASLAAVWLASPLWIACSALSTAHLVGYSMPTCSLRPLPTSRGGSRICRRETPSWRLACAPGPPLRRGLHRSKQRRAVLRKRRCCGRAVIGFLGRGEH